jgi:pseudaminic acid synthase
MGQKKIHNRLKDKKGACIVVAEISANHNQDIDTAINLIKKAKDCGVDGVKFQTYTPDTLTLNVNNKYFKVHHQKWGGQTLYQLYEKAYTPWSWFNRLKKTADGLGLIFFSTAFDKKSVDLLEELDVPFHKISSFELIDLPLVAYAAKTGKPLILSTGMASIREIGEAVTTAKRAGAYDIILLKCVSSYPAKPEDMNLRTIPHMAKTFELPVGVSDHSLGIGASIAAVCLGAVMVEKHFTLSRRIKTPDSFFSMEPAEMKELMVNIRTAEKALGRVNYGLMADEKRSRIFRRSLFVVKDMRKGELFSEYNVKSIRPANGLPPKYAMRILGRSATRSLDKGTPMKWAFVCSKSRRKR